MKAFKGCVNEECSCFQTRRHYKATENYCTMCGQPLKFVCADCWKVLDNNSSKYCINCEAKRKDKRDRAIDTIVQAPGKIANVVNNYAKDSEGMAADIKKIKDSTEGLRKGGKEILKKGKDVINKIPKKK